MGKATDDYDALAPVYERVFGPEAAASTWQTLTALLLPRLPARAQVLDLCCGTGEIAARLLGAGFRVTGVDRSAAMLAYARQRAPQATLIQSDLRTYQPQTQFDAAVCAYNSLPHIMRVRELRAVLAMVRRALRPHGPFVFDLYPEEVMASGWHGAHRANDCVLESWYRAPSARAVTQVYWDSGSARLCIRSYTRAELDCLLQEAGLQCEQRVRGAGRMFWCCSAPGDGSESECGGKRSGRRRGLRRSPGRDSSRA